MRTFFTAALLLFAVPLAAAAPSPPSQPKEGPGGSAYAHAALTKHRYRQGAQEYWLFEPAKPKPESVPVVVFLHGWGAMNPLLYGGWIEHLVKRGNIVVFP